MLIYKKCAVCGNKDTANHMTSKLTWNGTIGGSIASVPR